MAQSLPRAGAPDAAVSAAPAAPARATRDVRLLWCACAADAAGSNASGVVMPLLLLGFGYSPLFVGVVTGVLAAAGLVLAPLVALPADRGARKAVMFWSAAVSAAAMGALALALLHGRPPVPLLFGAVLVECVAAACYRSAAPGTVAVLAAPADVPRAVAGVEAGEQGALVLGPALGGVLYQLSRALPFVVDAASYVVTALCVRLMRSDLRAAPARAPGHEDAGVRDGGGLRAGVRLIASSRLLRLILLWVTVLNGVLAALTYQVLVALGRGGHGGVSAGTVLAVSGAAGLAGALAAPRLVARFGARPVLVAVAWALVPPVAGLAVAGGAPAYGGLFAAVCLMLPLVSVVLQTWAVLAIPHGAQARVGAVLTVASGTVGALAPMAAGLLLDRDGTRAAPLLCAAALAVLALRTTLGGRRVLGEHA